MIYDFKIKEVINLFNRDQSIVENIFNKRLEFRLKIVDVTSFINVKAKLYYNARHVSLKLKANDYAYLRLNHDYQLSKRLSKKIFSQRCGSFLIKRRIDRLTYKLKLSSQWKVHLMISVTQLESASTQNFYNRSRSNHFDSMKIEDDTPQWRFYVIERIIDKRMRIFENIKMIQYFIRWRDYGSKYDEWRSIIKLSNCMNLMKKYEIKQRVMKSSKTTPKLKIFITSGRRALQKVSASFDDAIFLQSGSFILRQSMIIIFFKISTSSIDSSFRRSKRLMRKWFSEDADLCFFWWHIVTEQGLR